LLNEYLTGVKFTWLAARGEASDVSRRKSRKDVLGMLE
jgi:hypothetical protein